MRRKKSVIQKRKWMIPFLAVSVLFNSFPLFAQEEAADKINSIVPMAEELVNDLSASIRKRAEWIDENTGEAKITLQYASNSGKIRGTNDMNVILIQDKSGSMDANYGFKIQLCHEGIAGGSAEKTTYVTAQAGSSGYDTAENLVQYTSNGQNYMEDLNCDEKGFNGGHLCNTEMRYNSPCQLEGHYYLLTEDDLVSGFSKGSFVHGNNLYNIAGTDLHHYALVNEQQAQQYRSQNRRVIKGKVYYNEQGKQQRNDNYFSFVDMSKVVTYRDKTYLSTVDTVCEKNDRLARSQMFMENIVHNIRNLNKNNKIAYIPFWGDVPQNNTWENLSSNGTIDNLYTETYQPQLVTMPDTTAIHFTSGWELGNIVSQIKNSFTYSGTNWTRALNNALEMLKNRSEKDKKRETLIIFLTDGKPQGFSGKETDVNNRLINGTEQIEQLHGMEGVTFYSVGVCINQADRSVIQRLNAADSSGEAFFARNTNEFDALMSKIEKRFNEEYVIPIQGKESFYTDIVADSFVIKEELLGENWAVLNDTTGEDIYGVPKKVYETAQNPKVNAVYAKDTKTVYWKIGNLTDGDYTAQGHSLSFPIQYTDYEQKTEGKELKIHTNTKQRLTYISTRNPEELNIVEIQSPVLLFNRENPPLLTVEKILKNWMPKETLIYKFAVCTSEQKEKVIDSILRFNITIAPGNTSGSRQLANLPSGKYYIYEIDDEGIIQNGKESLKIENENREQQNVVEIKSIPELLTVTQKQGASPSVVSSDGKFEENYNNYIKIAPQNAKLTFVQEREYGNLTVEKTIQAADDVIWWEHGNPTFLMRVKGIGADGKEHTFFHTFEFTKEETVRNIAEDGTCTLSYTFWEIPLSERYRIEEVKTSRYRLEKITANTQAVSVTEEMMPESGYFLKQAVVNLKENPEGVKIRFHNTKSNYKGYGDTAYVKNQIKK